MRQIPQKQKFQEELQSPVVRRGHDHVDDQAQSACQAGYRLSAYEDAISTEPRCKGRKLRSCIHAYICQKTLTRSS